MVHQLVLFMHGLELWEAGHLIEGSRLHTVITDVISGRIPSFVVSHGSHDKEDVNVWNYFIETNNENAQREKTVVQVVHCWGRGKSESYDGQLVDGFLGFGLFGSESIFIHEGLEFSR
jgi:hypothetical protein